MLLMLLTVLVDSLQNFTFSITTASPSVGHSQRKIFTIFKPPTSSVTESGNRLFYNVNVTNVQFQVQKYEPHYRYTT